MDPIISSEKTKEIFTDFARNSASKICVILGAGASRGYSREPNYLYTPPIVCELLDQDNYLVRETLKKSIHQDIKGHRAQMERRITNTFGGDLEAYLSDLYENDTADDRFPSMLRYLEDIFTLASNNADLDDNYYKSLLSTIRDLRGPKRWSVLTFNYDTILERSLADLPIFTPRRIFNKDEDYLNVNPKVLKMHGGVNLRYITHLDPQLSVESSGHQNFTEMMSNNEAPESYLELKDIKSEIPKVIGYKTYPDVGGRTITNFPLMMIPIHTSVGTANSFFGRQTALAKEEISQSGLVVAIGYQFGDGTFIESLKDLNLKGSTLILVGSKKLLEDTVDSRAYKEATKVWPKENIKIFGEDGFGSFVDALY
ncbi:MAG: hypothetical protein AAB586_02315 [Patescibacteria group bacterium]